MTKSGDFWRAELDGYNFEKHLSLPVDRCRSKTDQRSSAAYSARFSLNSDLSKSFLAYASSHNVTPFQLGLATFYVLLFKLSNGEIDLCISCVDANRYRPEIEDFVGMFIATLPYRVQIDPSRSFDHLVEQVRDKCLSILEHTHYPLQRILADSHKQQVNINFLDISFDFVNFLPAASQLNCDGAIMEPLVPDQWNETAKFDFMLTFQYDTFLEDKTISCFLVCSRDLYNEATVVKIARRFEYLLFQVFSPTYAKNGNNRSEVPLTRLTLILQEEAAEIEMMNFCRLPYYVNIGMPSIFQLFFIFINMLECYRHILCSVERKWWLTSKSQKVLTSKIKINCYELRSSRTPVRIVYS
ncbi:unnamed protein product [Rotaria sp. Silwood2]|nr:unnamed protein product [Rotaria sp. Silwood2]CAF3242628.1 unnamed protein product [Rotaria sp. Silwood2]